MDMLTDSGELKSGMIRTILMRRITLTVFTVIAFPMAFFLRISLLDPLLYAPLMWLLLTFPFRRLLDRQQTLTALHGTHIAYFVAEILLLTLLVHRLGGIAWIGGMFYVFTVIYANFFLPRLHGAAVTGAVVFAYAGLALAEFFGILPHRPLFAAAGSAHQSLPYILTTLLAGPVAVYALLAVTVRTFAGVYARKNRLLASREAQLAQMSRQLLDAHDKERQRIARSLHDDLIQCLAAIRLHLASARGSLDADHCDKINAIIETAISQTRSLAYSVRPPLLDDLGLFPSVQRLSDGLAKEANLRIEVQCDLEARLNTAIESLLFHAAQECLHNVVRHANATCVTVELRASDGWARMSVHDNGQGFPATCVYGLGLRGLRERVDVCGGRMAVESSPGAGARVTVEVPHDDDPCACG